VHTRPADIKADIFHDAFLNLDDTQMMEFVQDLVEEERSTKNPKSVSPRDVYFRRQLAASNGVACFSELPKHLLIWSHYADSHRGFCLEFATNYPPFDGHLFRVSYEAKMPTVSPSERDFGDIFELRRFLLTKAREWRYEKEWRIVSELSDTTIDYPPAALKRIFVGAKATTRTMNTLRRSVEGRPVEIVKLKLSDNRFRLEEVPA
ncbi:MAG: DUF2971 domain-containing protein, partial [Planctomycetaceae bacterium]|nr:DUF2971 domain-containing protein [Planctomycetaceae bacterium]